MGRAMPRTVNAVEYNEKRNEILDVAQRLVYTRGYEQMTIQDVLAELRISKGAFYHYFASKQDLLEGLIERMQQESEQLILASLQDPGLSPLARLQRYFDTVNRWESARKDYLLALLQVWFADDNAIVRQKVQATMVQDIAPTLTQVIVQGHAEGVFATLYPDQIGPIVIALHFSLGEACGLLILKASRQPDALERATRLAAAANDALERILGAPTGSLQMIDVATLVEWFSVTAAPAALA